MARGTKKKPEASAALDRLAAALEWVPASEAKRLELGSGAEYVGKTCG